MFKPDRRALLLGTASLCGAALSPMRAWAQMAAPADDGQDTQIQEVEPGEIYGPVTTEPYPVAAVNWKRLNPRYLRTEVEYPSNAPAGTIVIDPAQRFLYLTDGAGRAIRYGVGVGREGFAWAGTARVGAKREWPDWYPPKEMFARQPEIMGHMSKLQSGLGMHGGPGNPLGARAMYLYQGNKDMLYRIHGTIEPYSIGSAVSSGCIRMINQDVLDLYERVPIGTEVRVLGTAGQAVARDDSENFDQEPAPRPSRRSKRVPLNQDDGYGTGYPDPAYSQPDDGQ